MALIKSLRGKSPQFGKDCYLAENATIIGDVVRGDVHFIKMGDRVNIQDGAVIHATYQKSPTTIGNDVSIAHNAIVHGCTIEDQVLIGMGAIVMDDVHIGSNCIIAAGSIVLQNTIVEPNSIYAGTPAKKIKDLDESAASGEIKRIAGNYMKYSEWYK